MSETQTCWYIVVNPHAGSGKTMPEWAKAEKRLKALNIPFVAGYSQYRMHAKALAYAAASEGYRNILAVGGDGTVHEVLCGLMRYAEEKDIEPEEFCFGVLPIGSGNDWIKSLGIPHNLDKMLEMVADGTRSRMDVVKVESSDGVSYMANVGGMGFDSHVCERVNRQKAHGRVLKAIYLRALFHTVRWIRPINATVRVDGEEFFSGSLYSLAMGNGPYSGGGMRQVPDAVYDDGLLDFMVCPKVPLKRIVREIPRLFNGTVRDSGILKMGRCKELEIMAEREEIYEVDGEIEGRLPVRISMTGHKINIVAEERH